jgi:hypothetical protein
LGLPTRLPLKTLPLATLFAKCGCRNKVVRRCGWSTAKFAFIPESHLPKIIRDGIRAAFLF